jgi:hypothetical protein
MSTHLIVGIAAIACMGICGIIAMAVGYEMIEKVNHKLPQEDQLGWAGWYPSKYQRLYREYRRLYPEGRLLFKIRVLATLGIACLLICAWCVGFFAS